jgi:hypothetical protein
MCSWALILDTHIVVSLLAEAEEDHKAVTCLVQSWQQLRRNVHVPKPVAEETSYNAWIAQIEVEHMFPVELHATDTIPHPPQNPFLRSFLLRESNRFHRNRWRAYIGNYIGKDSTDSTRLEAVLNSLHLSILPDASVVDKASAPVRRPTVRLSRAGEVHVQMKPVWDERLIAIARQTKSTAGDGVGGVIIISNSSAIRMAFETAFPRDRVPVMSRGVVGLLLSMLPGSSVSLVHVRELLFDEQPFLELDEGMKRKAVELITNDHEDGLDLMERQQLAEELSKRLKAHFTR